MSQKRVRADAVRRRAPDIGFSSKANSAIAKGKGRQRETESAVRGARKTPKNAHAPLAPWELVGGGYGKLYCWEGAAVTCEG